MITGIKHITFDASDPQKLAKFWSQATGLAIKDDFGGFVSLESKPGWPHFAFLRTNSTKSVKDRIHPDFVVDDEAAESQRLQKLGAREESQQRNGDLTWRVMADPEGNEFCISSHW